MVITSSINTCYTYTGGAIYPTRYFLQYGFYMIIYYLGDKEVMSLILWRTASPQRQNIIMVREQYTWRYNYEQCNY